MAHAKMLALAMCALPLLAALAQDDPVQGLQSASQEQAQIDARRASANAEFDAQEQGCQKRFMVNKCLDDVREQRIAFEAELRRQELSLHNAQRMQKAASALQQVEQKQQEKAQKEREQALNPDTTFQERQQALEEKQRAHAQALAQPPAAARQAAASAPNPAEQAQKRAAYAQKQLDAQKHRAEVQQRIKDKAADKPLLPLPSDPP